VALDFLELDVAGSSIIMSRLSLTMGCTASGSLALLSSFLLANPPGEEALSIFGLLELFEHGLVSLVTLLV
jgi:hypothetical protein